jgi:membrane protein
MSLWPLLKETYVEWDRHQVPKLGAGLAYYTVLSLAPLLIVVITVVGMVLGPKAAQGEIIAQIQGLVGPEGAEAIQAVIANANQPKTGIVASLLGLITLFLGASGVFAELHDALNTIWDAPPRPGSGLLSMIRERFLSFGMVLAIGFLLLVSLVVSAGVAAAATFMGGVLPVPGFVLQGANLLLSLGVITVLFAMIYRFLPSERVPWRDVWIGAAATAVLFSIGKLLIGMYLGKASVGSAYGAAGSLVVVLVWVYYSAQIFFFGAEFTHVYARARRPEAFPVRQAPVATVPVEITGQAMPLPVCEPERVETEPRRQPVPAAARAVAMAALAGLGAWSWYRARRESQSGRTE